MVPSGGRRAGAGRPALPEKDKRVTLAVRVLPRTDRVLADLAARWGRSRGDIIDELVRKAGG